MPQQSEAKLLRELTEVPAGWPLATVIDAFLHLARYTAGHAPAQLAREALSLRLVELWASQPEEAEAWLERFGELKTATRPERLCEALLRHGAAEFGKYVHSWPDWRFSEAGLLRGELRPAADREAAAASYLQQPDIRERCRELAERLVVAESQETARKRQKLEEETAQRRRLEAELQKSQEESRELGNRLAAAEAEVSSKDAELRTAQNENAKCKEQCEEFATRAAAGDAAVTEMQKELRQLQEEHSKCQEHCQELAARMEAEASEHTDTRRRLAQAESDAAAKELEVRRLQEDQHSYQAREHCPQAEAHPAPAKEACEKAELLLQKAVLQERCEQLRQQLAKAESKLDLVQDLREEIGMYKERLRGLEHELTARRKKQDALHMHFAGGTAFNDAATDGQESSLAEQLGYSVVEDDATSSSVLSCSSWFSVKPESVKPHCFMVDAIFKTRSYGTDFFLMGRDLKKGSQVVAGDDAAILTVTSTPDICDATEVVELQAGAATLHVTPDHWVQVADAKGEAEKRRYLPAGKLKAGDFVMLDSGEPVTLTSVAVRPLKCQVLKIIFEPHLPVAVFSRPACILSLGHKPKPPIRRGGRGQGQGQASQAQGRPDGSLDGGAGASIPVTAGDYMD